MPTFDAGKWVVRIGPRLAFSEHDGSFVVNDLRSRCATITWPSVSLPLDSDPQKVLALIYLGAQDWDAVTSDGLKRFNQWIQSAKLDDQEYTMWFLTLCGRVATDDIVFPTRIDQEAPRIEDAKFGLAQIRINVDKMRIWHEAWQAPPPGKARSNGPWALKEREIAVAQPRPKDAPDLVWSGGDSRRSDSNLDNWWEQAGYGADKK